VAAAAARLKRWGAAATIRKQRIKGAAQMMTILSIALGIAFTAGGFCD
jgi:hypothetical protein